jgi:ABC-type Fe3+ transport system substrate-binding protein
VRESWFFIQRRGLKTRINSLRHSPKNIRLSKGVIIAPAPHPNAGKLFLDFILSQEGARLLRGQQRIPARLDVEPLTERLNPNKLKLYPVNISIEKLDPRGFRKFFGVSE